MEFCYFNVLKRIIVYVRTCFKIKHLLYTKAKMSLWVQNGISISNSQILGSSCIKLDMSSRDGYLKTDSISRILHLSVSLLEVPDVVCQEYISPSYRSSKYSAAPPSLLNFLPKPPDVPPPPEDYYATTEISNLPLMSSPPLSQHSAGHSAANCHFMLPLSPEPDNCSDCDEDAEIERFPRERLRIIEKLGEGHFEDVHLCEMLDSPEVVVVYTLRLESYKYDFRKEVKGLAKIKDANVSRLLGACLDSQPICVAREYSEYGDLCQFLQDHVAETATPIINTASCLR